MGPNARSAARPRWCGRLRSERDGHGVAARRRLQYDGTRRAAVGARSAGDRRFISRLDGGGGHAVEGFVEAPSLSGDLTVLEEQRELAPLPLIAAIDDFAAGLD